MIDGSWKSIDQFVIGDVVKMPDGSSALVSNLFNNGLSEIVKIHLQNGTFFECSDNHRWFVYNHKTDTYDWVETKNLSDGDYSMVDPTGNHNKIVGIEYTGQFEQTYDLEVDHPDHLFIAQSDNGALRNFS